MLSSEKIRPIVDNGRWMVRRSPATAAFSSSPSCPLPALDPPRDEDALAGTRSASREFLGVTSGLLSDDFSETCTPGDGCRLWVCGRWRCSSKEFLSAIAETAASTFFSNSSSVIVRLVRSRFSMNWIAPIWTP